MKKIIPVLSVAAAVGSPLTFAQQVESTAQAPQELQEVVVVTARYREERLQDVGAAITSFDGNNLERNAVKGVADLVYRTPGVDVFSRGPNSSDISVRGMANMLSQTDFQRVSSLTGIFIDGVSVTVPFNNQRAWNMFDLERVEMLRGPQGTLYGEGSMGGAIRYVSRKPNLGEFQARANTTFTTVSGGDDLGSYVNGTVNLPIVQDRLGVRVTGFYRDDPGFIDYRRLDKDHANSFTNKGFRAVALGKIDDRLTIQVTALHESARSDSAWTATGDVEDLENDFHQLLEPQEDEATLVSAQIDYATAFGTLTSITGYYKRSLDSLGLDATSARATSLPVSKTWLIDHESLSEELRFVSDLDGPWGFLVGAYYKDSKQSSDLLDRLDTAALTGIVLNGVERYEGEQISLFGELSYQLTDQLTLTGGLRYFKEDVDSRQLWNSPELIFSFIPTNEFATKISIEKVLPKVLLEYKATDSTLLYAGASEGARYGGLNVTSTISFIAFTGVDTAPFRSYREDSARSYEIGAKTSWLEGQLVANAAIYYTQWQDMQLQVTTPPLPVFPEGLGYVGNASGDAARSEGAEVEMEYRPSESFRFFLGGTLADARFTKEVDVNPTLGTIAPKGSPIPGVSDWSFSVGSEISHPIAGGFARAVGRVSYQRRAEARSFITTTGPTGPTPNFTTPEFGLLNLGIGLEADTWRVDVFANNATNEIVGLYQAFSDRSFYINQPRTIGITLEKSF